MRWLQAVGRLPRVSILLGPTLACVLLVAQSGVAFACYYPHAGAWRDQENSDPYSGVLAKVDLFAASPANNSSTIVHPLQVAVASGDFVGLGTAIGKGVDQCPDYFGSNWQVYVDGQSFGVYFCRQPFGSLASTAKGHIFFMQYITCPFDTTKTLWVAYFDGYAKLCVGTNGSSAIGVGGGGESIYNHSQKIDVRYYGDEYRKGTSWYLWGSGASCADSAFSIQTNSDSDFKVYLR